jgi:hypothetical protein
LSLEIRLLGALEVLRERESIRALRVVLLSTLAERLSGTPDAELKHARARLYARDVTV